jgi:hypothetical protein
MSIVADVQAYLADRGVVDGSTGWPSVRRRVHDGSDRLVILTEDGGFEPEIGVAGGIGDAAYRDPQVQVRVRGAAWDGDGAEEVAQMAYDALHGLMGVEIGSTRYLRVAALTGGPVFIGFDGNGRPEFTCSYRFAVAVGAPL